MISDGTTIQGISNKNKENTVSYVKINLLYNISLHSSTPGTTFLGTSSEDQGTAAVLFMTLAKRMYITKLFLIISQKQRKTKVKQDATHHSRPLQHTAQSHIGSATD